MVVEVVDLVGLFLQVDLVDRVEQETLEMVVMVEMLRVILEVVAEVVVETHLILAETAVVV